MIAERPITTTVPKLRCLGRKGDIVSYKHSPSGGGPPYPVALDVVEHTSRCECRAGFVGHRLCYHQRAAINDWYERRARVIVAGDDDKGLRRRERENVTQRLDYVTKATNARRLRDWESAVKFDGFALRSQIMLDAIGDEIAARAT